MKSEVFDSDLSISTTGILQLKQTAPCQTLLEPRNNLSVLILLRKYKTWKKKSKKIQFHNQTIAEMIRAMQTTKVEMN